MVKMGLRFLSAEPFILLYTIVFSMHMAALPQLLLKKVCLRRFNSTLCQRLENRAFKAEQDYVHEHSSIWMLILIAAGLIPSLITILIWGPLADKWGRKKTMLIPPICLTLQSLAYLFSSVYVHIHPGFLLFGAIVTSFYGEFQGAVAVAYSLIADVTCKDSNRTMRMAVIEGMVFFAGAPAGLLTGLILDKAGFDELFLTTICLNIINFLYVLLYLPASVPRDRQSSNSSEAPILDSNPEPTYGQNSTSLQKENDADSFNSNARETGGLISFGEQLKDNYEYSAEDTVSSAFVEQNLLNPISHLKDVCNLVFSRTLRHSVLPCIIAFGFSVMAFTGELYITVLYIRHQPLSLTEEEVGYYLAAQAAIRGLGVILSSQLTIRCCKVSDFTLVFVGLLSQCCNYVLVALSTTKVMLYLVTLTGVTMPLATSSMRSIISKQVDSRKHGTILSAIEAMDIFGSLISNLVINTVYFGSVASVAGLSFYVLAGFAFISMCTMFTVFVLTRNLAVKFNPQHVT